MLTVAELRRLTRVLKDVKRAMGNRSNWTQDFSKSIDEQLREIGWSGRDDHNWTHLEFWEPQNRVRIGALEISFEDTVHSLHFWVTLPGGDKSVIVTGEEGPWWDAIRKWLPEASSKIDAVLLQIEDWPRQLEKLRAAELALARKQFG
ncbi:MAG TPA: hypothetical protein VF092_26250 [Longimicrobium sp.]